MVVAASRLALVVGILLRNRADVRKDGNSSSIIGVVWDVLYGYA